MAIIDAKVVLERLKFKLSVKTDAELAEKLGVPYQTLNSWKKRGSIPMDVLVEASEKYHVSLDYMFTLNNTVEDEDYIYLMYEAAEIAAGEAFDEQKAENLNREEFLVYFRRLRMNFEHQCIKLSLREKIELRNAISVIKDDWYSKGVVGKYTPRTQPFVFRPDRDDAET